MKAGLLWWHGYNGWLFHEGKQRTLKSTVMSGLRILMLDYLDGIAIITSAGSGGMEDDITESLVCWNKCINPNMRKRLSSEKFVCFKVHVGS